MPVSARSSDQLAAGYRRSVAAALILTAAAGHAAAAPRVMSLNVCTDQLVLQLADPGQVVSVSALSADARLSFHHRLAEPHDKNAGLAEEVLAARPDIVVTGVYSLHNTTELLARLGVAVEEFDFVQALETIPGEVRRMGRIVGQPDRGETVAGEFERDLAALRMEADAQAPTVLVYGQNGVALGAGTLADSVLRAAGLRNLATERGIEGMAPYPLELVIVDRPDLLLLSAPYADAPALADRIALHPALAGSGSALKTGVVPAGAWECAGPFTIEALRTLRALRDAFVAEREQ